MMSSTAASLTCRRGASAEPTPAEAAAKCGLLVPGQAAWSVLTASAFPTAASAERSAATDTVSLELSAALSRERRPEPASGGIMQVMVPRGSRLDSPVMWQPGPDLAGHQDRVRWNQRYSHGFVPSFAAHPLAVRALSLAPQRGPVLELACGPSGSVLLAAAAGRQVTALDASDVALRMLESEAERRGLDGLITLVHADAATWRPESESYSLILCTGFWDRAVFAAAVSAVADGGLIGWEALTTEARLVRPEIPAHWCVAPGEPAALLPAGFVVVAQRDRVGSRTRKRQLLAARRLVHPAD